MAVYRYKAKKDPQNTVEGTVEAHSEKEAIEKISLLGFIPVHLQVQQEQQRISSVSGIRSRLTLSSSLITVFSRQLASLLRSGVPILKSLRIIMDQSESRIFKAVLADIYKEVEDGSPFSTVLAQYPRIFPALYIAMVRAGEDSGQLPTVLLKIAEYRAKEEETRSRLRMAMLYPTLMALVGAGTIVFMFTYVMPRLMQLYNDMGQKLPIPTKILLGISAGLQQWWLGGVFALAFAGLILQRFAQTRQGKAAFSFLWLHVPIIGNLILKAELARFARTLELLLKSGIPILRALSVTLPVLGNEVIKGQLNSSYKELEQGGSLGRHLKNSSVVPLFMSNLIIVGEESGKLDDALAELAQAYERDTDDAIRMMSSMLEPLLILVMGVIVGFIVIAMLLPIFEINVMVQ